MDDRRHFARRDAPAFVARGQVHLRSLPAEYSVPTGRQIDVVTLRDLRFLPEFAELVWSDGTKVDRKLIDLKGTALFVAGSSAYASTRRVETGVSLFGIRLETAHSPSRFT